MKSGDTLEFTFKSNVFKAQLFTGGILGYCTWNGTPVFNDRSGFQSLTDWSDTCIQECLSEFVTRFSSWKRIRHEKTGLPMHMLRARLWEMKPSGRASTSAVTEEDLMAERKKVLFLSQKVASLEYKLAAASKDTQSTNIGAPVDDNPFRLQF